MSSRDHHHVSRPNLAGDQTATVEALTRRAHYNLEQAGVAASPSKVSRIIRRYLRDLRDGLAPDFDAYFMPHADPTGEAAIASVMGRSSRSVS